MLILLLIFFSTTLQAVIRDPFHYPKITHNAPKVIAIAKCNNGLRALCVTCSGNFFAELGSKLNNHWVVHEIGQDFVVFTHLIQKYQTKVMISQ